MNTTDAPESTDRAALLDRLSRRGVLNITAEDGSFEVRFKAPGPYRGRSWCTTDEADFYEHCRLGAKNWQGDGPDLDALLVLCEMETRPDSHDVDDLVWSIERRRDSRTYGPPLPWYKRWDGWRSGQERWLRTFSHAHEYLARYLRDVEEERTFEAQRAADAARREADELRRHRLTQAGIR